MLPGFHRAWKPLATLAAAVEDYLDHAAHTNIYITPAHSSGFDPHYDAHEVFVLQISGRKYWKIYPPVLELPHQSQVFHPRMFTPSAPMLEVDLEPGDLLYVPRGVVHTTNTLNDASTHVTLGVTVHTWVELLAIWLQSSKDELAFRRALPPGFASRPELQKGLADEFSQLVASLHGKLDSERLVAALLDRVREGCPGRAAIRGAFHTDAAIGLGSELKALEPAATPSRRKARASC